MHAVAGRAWEFLGGLAAPKFVARETAVLLILAASLLVFRTLRERCLLVWMVGWLAYLGSHHTLSTVTPYNLPIGHAEFALAVCLFVAGAFIYSHAHNLLAPLLGLTVCLVAYAFVQALWWPGSETLRFALELSYRVLTFGAAVQVLRFRRARREIGPWILCVGLISLHLPWWPVNSRFPTEAAFLLDICLGIGMLLVVFDESRLHTRRLAALNALTSTISRASQNGPMAATALKELKDLMAADAAWFRLAQNHKLVIFQQIGLSQEFLRERISVADDDPAERIPHETHPLIFSRSVLTEISPPIVQEKLQQLVVATVPGRKAAVGTLVLGSRRPKSYAADELDFLVSCAQQLGLALENFHLVEEILRSHRQWSNTFESIQDLVLLHDSEYRIQKANPALLRELGKSNSEVVGLRCDAVLPKRNVEWTHCPYCRGEEDGFHEGPDPFGGFSVASTSSYVDQGTKQRATIHVIRDITERRAAEEKYRSLFEQVQEGVFVVAADGKLLDCNDAFVRMLGYAKREELIGRNLETEFYVLPEQRNSFRAEIARCNSTRNFEVALRRRDGTTLMALESSFATRGVEGAISGYQGFLLDITDKKHAEDEIRRRNRELNALNAMAVIATQSFDLDEILNLTLRQVVSLFSAESGSVYLAESETRFHCRATWGRSITDRKRFADLEFPSGLGELVMGSRAEVLTAEYFPHLPEAVAGFVRGWELGSSIWVVLWGKDAPIGLLGVSRSSAGEYLNNDENLLVAIGRQLATTVEKVRLYEETCKAYDDLRRAQEQLLQSEKMSAIGQLIAGVAHELNNPLTAILGYAQLLESEKLAPRALDYAGKIFKQARRTHRVVQNLLSFARQRKPQKEEFDVAKVLEEALLLREYDLKINGVVLQRELPHDLPAVVGDPHQIEQVFLNIINNALDSMLDGVTRNLKVTVKADKQSVLISFHDSGPGIKEANRVFEPFYTTKSVGKGTGLGLSICYGILKEHGGEISASNGDRGGAIIEVRLPSAGRALSASSKPEIQKRELALEGSILLVEDEEAVLEFERDVLIGAGARVTPMTRMEGLQSMLDSYSFDALILNGKMPGAASVAETRRWLLENWPGFSGHLLFTFSSLAEPDIRSFLEQNNVPFLVKPFQIGDLIAASRRVLTKARAAEAK
jgi:PAS domain S-box-containing protein